MRPNLERLTSRAAVLACGLAIFSSACGGGSGGSGGQGGAKTDGGADAGKTDAGAGGQAGFKQDGGAGAGGAAVDGGQGGRIDGGAGGGDAAVDGGAGGTGLPLGLPWRAFLPLGMAAPGSGVMMGTTSDLGPNHYDANYLGATVNFANAALNLSGAAGGAELVAIQPKNSVPAVDVTGSYSVSVWATLANTGGFRTIVSGEGFSVASFYLQKRADTNAWAYTAPPGDSTVGSGCIVPNGPDGGPTATPITPVVNVQYHLVATRDATTGIAILYVNGVESGRDQCGAGWTDTGIVGIGHGIFAGNRGDYVQGSIAELGLINRVLTATEVSNLYAAGRAGMGGPDAGVDVGTDVGPGDAGPPDAPVDSPAGTDGSATDAAATDAAADGG